MTGEPQARVECERYVCGSWYLVTRGNEQQTLFCGAVLIGERVLLFLLPH